MFVLVEHSWFGATFYKVGYSSAVNSQFELSFWTSCFWTSCSRKLLVLSSCFRTQNFILKTFNRTSSWFIHCVVLTGSGLWCKNYIIGFLFLKKYFSELLLSNSLVSLTVSPKTLKTLSLDFKYWIWFKYHLILWTLMSHNIFILIIFLFYFFILPVIVIKLKTTVAVVVMWVIRLRNFF